MHVLARFVLAICLAAALQGQSAIHGSLRGRLLDPNGLGVPGVALSLVHMGTGAEQMAESDGEGGFQFARLVPGRYRATAERAGFRKLVREGLEVAVNETASVDLAMVLGETAELITVVADGSIVQSQRTEIAGRVDERRVRELPLNGENFAKLILLAPGIAGGSPNNPSVSGARPVANNYTVDGASANDERGSNGLSLGGGGAAEFNGASPNLVSTEAVQEFGIITSNADASFGRGSGAQVNIITKSGSNEIHGSLYHYLRNNQMDARDYFNYGPFFAQDGSRRSVTPPFKQNLFGGSIGGPVVRNRHFFFGNFEGFRQKLEQTASATVPNAALLSQMPGQFGRLMRLFYIDRGVVPATGNPAGSFSVLTAAERTAALAAGFPTALFNNNLADGEAGSVLLSTTNTRDVSQDAFLIRTDHRLTDRLSVNGRYAFAQPFASINQRAVAGVVEDSRRRWQSGTAQFVYILSPAQTLEGRGSLLRSRIFDAPRDPLEQSLVDFGVDAQLGLQIRANGTSLSPMIIPRSLGLMDNQTVPQGSLMHSWSRGRLTLRSGLDVRRLIVNNILVSNASFMQFTGLVGNNGYLGSAPNQAEAIVTELNTTLYGVNGGPSTPQRGWRATEQEYFTQADFRWRAGLTLNAGVRFSPAGAIGVVGNYQGNLYAVDSSGKPVPGISPFTNGPRANAMFSVGPGRQLFNTDWNNWQPRLGLAWDVNGRGHTVMRAAWGVYTDRFFQRLFDFGVLNSPYAHSSIFTNLAFPSRAQIPLRTDTPPQQRVIDPGLRSPTTHRFNAAVERKLAAQTSLTVAYVGLRATGLYRWTEPNGLGSVPQAARPDPRYSRYRYTDNSGDSIYHSLQMFARHRFSRGIDFTVAYTYGNSVDTYSQDVGDNSIRNAAPGLAQFPSLINLKGTPAAGFQGDAQSWVARPILAERGNSDFNVRHNLTISHVVEVPVGRGRRWGNQMPRALEAIAGGFSLAGFAQMRTALPVYLSSGVDYADVGITTSPRPALKQGTLEDLYAAGTYDKTQFWLPKSEADLRLGTPANVLDPYAATRRNALFGPNVYFYDLSVIKKFTVREQARLSFEANFFNIFNRAIFGPPVAVLSDARFGRVTGTLAGSNPRQIQLGLKLGW
ncbi:MAG: carboxypeptidase regulatory-like domain-containing protein [Acidobacteria bacterium]|nr:carboxypeptidase regulatory-like domain-containing protein [Acidobacteriota bacterium]